MISNTEKKHITDLQFPTVLKQFQAFVIPKLVKKKALNITPFRDKETLMQALMQTSEYALSK
jgi:DNA mismatch repair protein MutS2